ncbi:MAG: CapA family protein [Anaerolineales bacterium]|nr:CapA family protein [Anaerolineales bacterium]
MKRFTRWLLFLLLTACTRSSSTAPLSPPLLVTPIASPTAMPLNTETPVPTETPTRLPSETPSPTAVPTETPGAPPLLNFLFTGPIYPAPCNLGQTLFTDVLDYLQPANLTLGGLMGSPTECPDDFARVLIGAGFDILGLNTEPCGEENCQPDFELQRALRENGILLVEGGGNAEGAAQPLMVEVQGVRVGFVGWENGALNEDALRAGIAAAREQAEVVIVLPAWGTGTDPFPDPDQLALAQVAADAGADLIVGNHPQIQAFGEVEGVPVFFGLGNFYGDEGAAGMMVRVYFRGTEFLGYELFPTLTETEGKIRLMNEAETTALFETLQQLNEQLP